MKRHTAHRGKYLIAALILSLIFVYPWLFKDFVGVEHDTFFHLSRIQGLAEAISRGDLLPAIYPYKNNGYGYASPLFYCDILVYPAALLYLLHVPLSYCYIAMIWLYTFVTAYTCQKLFSRLTGHFTASLAVTIAYLFCNYRITDVFVRSAIGETAAMMFLPVLLSGLYEVLWNDHPERWYLLTIGLAGLIWCHNLTFLMGAVLFVIMVFMRRFWKDPRIFKALFYGAFTAFLLTAWFTIPMLEQVFSQKLYVSWYAKHSDLEAGSLTWWKYLVNRTVFGYSGQQYEKDKAMVVNPGYFLMIMPVLYPEVSKKKDSFPYACMILGYIFLFLPCALVPWKYLSFLRVLQFPWRLITLAGILLSVPAAAVLSRLNREVWIAVFMTVLLCEGVWHLNPVFDRTFGITSETVYEDITGGKLCDPYYSASYMRVELAGGDYLPMASPDFRKYEPAVRNTDQEILPVEYAKTGNEVQINVPEEYAGTKIELPLTWYKGYRVYRSEGALTAVECASDERALVSFVPQKAGTYICRYESTFLRRICIAVSLLAHCALIAYAVFKKIRTS